MSIELSKAKIKYINSLSHKKYRDQEGIFIAEGPKLVSELEPYFQLVEKYDGESVNKVSLLDTPQQVLALFRKREETQHVPAEDELCIALSDIQNPGNLGTIVRLADWYGIEHIICSRGCADIYNPKTVQATMGAMARVHVHYCDLATYFASLPEGYPIYGTFLNGDNIYSSPLTHGGIIIMGNEGHGIPDDIERFVNHRLYIPNYPVGRPTTQSLNVAIATAITCSEFRRTSLCLE